MLRWFSNSVILITLQIILHIKAQIFTSIKKLEYVNSNTEYRIFAEL